MVNIVTEVMPTTVKSYILRAKIHMQTLLGNVFGLRFASLEADCERLDQL